MTQSATQTHGSLFRRIRHTPLRDVLRLRLTGRLDYRARVAASGLPVEAQALILRVVRRTRLHKLERVGVADELIAHFADGLEAGTPVDQLLAAFGEERTAARLIRRAKLRNRPMAWQAFNVARWCFAGLVVMYGLSAAVFFAGRPSPKVDYVARLNRVASAAGASERAWPLYARAIAQLAGAVNADGTVDRSTLKAYREARTRHDWTRLTDSRPGDSDWSRAAALTATHRESIDLLQQAAARPVFGFRVGRDGDAYDPDVFPNASPPPPGDPAGDTLFSIHLPYLQDIRVAGDWLALDAAVAGAERDADRWIKSVDALLNLAAHARQDRILITELVSIALTERALLEIERVLLASPDLLTESALRRIAHQIGGASVAADLVGFDGERMFFDDVVQRVYTDDGRGDGRITPAGLRLLEALSRPQGGVANDKVLAYAVAPAAVSFAASRRELTVRYDRLMALCNANLARPLRDADWQTFESELQSVTESPLQRARYLPLSVLFPSFARVQWTAERSLARREAVVVGIALELHRRHHGAYPERLELLAPAFLPAVPSDRIDGAPLRYRVIDGKPLLYSVGADRDDDSGRAYVSPRGDAEPNRPAAWAPRGHEAPVDADWVLFPQPQPHREPRDDGGATPE